MLAIAKMRVEHRSWATVLVQLSFFLTETSSSPACFRMICRVMGLMRQCNGTWQSQMISDLILLINRLQ